MIQAGTIYGGIHVHAPSVPSLTRHRLPAPAHMVNRREALETLRADTGEAGKSGRPCIRVLIGTGGVGKTAVAARHLDVNAADFPDGCLVAALSAFGPSGPADPSHVLDFFLRSLGADATEIPSDLAARSALFQARTHGRRLAVLLDDAASAAQVTALLPGEGAHLVVVTTRLHLTALIAHGARFTPVRPLAPDDSARLIARLGAGVGADVRSDDALDLAELCGHLPLALCAAAGRMLLRPGRAAERMVAELRGEHRRLGGLSRDAELSPRAVFDASHAALPDSAARLYRLLGLHPGADFSPADADALVGAPAEEDLDHLLAASLLEARSDRYAFHDLLREHAREKADELEGRAELDAALNRLVDHHLDAAVAADLSLNPRRWHLGPRFERAGPEGKEQEAPVDRDAVLDELDAELPTRLALVRSCSESGRHEAAWQLCEAMWAHFSLRKHYDAWVESHRFGVRSARALEDPAAEARMGTALGSAYLDLRRADEAFDLYAEALTEWTAADHALGRASALEGMGTAEVVRQRPERAVPYFSEALAVHTGLGRRRGIALMNRRLGEALRDVGDAEAAADRFRTAVESFGAMGDDYLSARSLLGLAELLAGRGEHDGAVIALTDALAAAERATAPMETARVHALLGEVHAAQERWPTARHHLSIAAAIAESLDSPEVGAMARRLAGLPRSAAAGSTGPEGSNEVSNGDGAPEEPGAP